MIEIVLPRHLAADYGARVEQAGGGRVRLLPVRGCDPRDPDLGTAQVAVNGAFDGPGSFGDVLAAMPNLRWVHSLSAGIDDFISPELVARGCRLTNSAGVYAPAMAEYAFAGMVMLGRGMPGWLRDQERRVWGPPLVAPGRELYGRRVAILGDGVTGRYVATLCRAAGMEVWASRRTPGPAIGEPLDRLLPADAIEELVSGASFLVVCAPLTRATRGIVDAAALALLAPGAVLVNVGRGGIVDEAALVAALESGRLGGALVDVTETEPLPPGSPLWSAPNLWVTPHIAGNTPDCWERSIDLFCGNLAAYLDGDPDRMGNPVALARHL
jgi:phosphoglycerate dehydrogenase-like enzyme